MSEVLASYSGEAALHQQGQPAVLQFGKGQTSRHKRRGEVSVLIILTADRKLCFVCGYHVTCIQKNHATSISS